MKKAMTEQEIFDKVLFGIREQGSLCYETDEDGNGVCKYRLERDGKTLKCAAGHLIPDADYLPAMEGYTIVELLDTGSLEGSLAKESIENNLFLIRLLQEVHDYYTNAPAEMCTWERRMRNMASNLELHYTEPKQP